MKKLVVLFILVALMASAQATPLEDKIKTFTDAIQASDKVAGDPNLAERGPAFAAELKMALSNPERGGNIQNEVTQMMSMFPSDAVQQAGKALLAEIEAERKTREDALTAKVDAVVAQVPDLLTKAQKPQELDGILDALQKVQSPRGGGYGYDQGSQAQMSRVNAAYQFVAQWQDYLSARNNGNNQEAQNSLRNLLNSRSAGDAPLVPRSEILAQLATLTAATKTAGGTAPQAVGREGIENVLREIKTLDDLEPALRKIRALPNIGYDLGGLSQLVSAYANSRNGLPTTFDVTPNNGSNANDSPEFGRVRAMVIIYLLPRYVGSNALPPNPDETVNSYLNRSIEAAAAKEDWISLQRLMEAQVKIAGNNAIPSGTRAFLAGMNQEGAGQYALAVASYQSALANPDDYLPVKVVGERLAGIKKDHAAEYEEGSKRYLNPPAVIYANPAQMRSGMPGYGNYVTNSGMPVVPVPAPMKVPSAAPTLSPAATNAPAAIAPSN